MNILVAVAITGSITIGAVVYNPTFKTEGIPFNGSNPKAVYMLQPTTSGESLQYGADLTRQSVEDLEVK